MRRILRILQRNNALKALFNYALALPAKLREEDKIKHISWSFWLTLGALFFLPSAAALTLVLLIGLAKECWDFRYGSGFCMFDMAANFIGIGAAQCFWYITAQALSI